MKDLTKRQRTKYLFAAIAVEYGCLYLALLFGFSAMGSEPTDAELANFLLGCAFVAMLFGWAYAAKLAGGFWDLVLLELPLFAPIGVTGIAAMNGREFPLSITCFVLVIGLTLLGLQHIRNSDPSSESPKSWAEYIEPHVGAIRASAIGLIALVAVLWIGGVIVKRIDAPVTEGSLATSVEKAIGSAQTGEIAKCFAAENNIFWCDLEQAGGGNRHSYRVDVRPGSSCWAATREISRSVMDPRPTFYSCVKRFPDGWSGVLGT